MATIITAFAGFGMTLLMARLSILRLRHPRDWWRGDWPTFDPYYRDVQRRLSRGKDPPDALETRIWAATELIFLAACFAALILWVI